MEGSGRVRVAFQGDRGAYSEEAARLAVPGGEERVRGVPCPRFRHVFDAVAAGEADFGIVPIENSLAGSVRENYDLLLERDLHVVGERYLPIRHCLMALPGTELSGVELVLSHPQALAQCSRTLSELLPEAERRAEPDTAGSARRVREEGMREAAAVASERAADVHGLRVLRRGIEDHPDNVTRFLVLGTEPSEAGPDAKTTVVFSGENEPGLLYRCLGAFARRGIDLTKIESRPLAGSAWEYVFYLDFRGRASDPETARALEEMEEAAALLRVLGSYPRGEP